MIQHNSRQQFERASMARKESEQAAAKAAFEAQRADLLVDTYSVGADEYTSQFWQTDKRPDVALEFDGDGEFDVRRTLHRLPNGDWMEIIAGKAWVRHTYDTELALDRARRQAIGGYTLSHELAEALRAVISAGAHQMGGWVILQDHRLERGHDYVGAYSGTGNQHADEKAARWAELLEEAKKRHTDHVGILDRAISALREPEAVREYPAPIDSRLSGLIRDLEKAAHG